MKYAILMKGRYITGTEPNATYCPMSKAPTMGRRHDASEFRTVWGDKPVYFERLTVTSYISTLLEEFRWGDMEPEGFLVVPDFAKEVI